MFPSNLTFTSGWWLPTLALVVVAVVVLFWSYGRSPGGIWFRIALCFRLAALLALAFCLLDPLWTRSRPRPGANLLAILADTSDGMNIRDTGSRQTRGEGLQEQVAHPDSGWQGSLSKNFEVRRYRFDSRLEPAPSLEKLTFDGRSSNLGLALRQLAARFKSRPLAGIVVLTDGNATDLTESSLATLTGLPPIYPVVMGNDTPPRDVGIQEASASLGAFEDTPVALHTRVTSDGFPGRTIVARVRDTSGREILRQEQTSATDHAGLDFRFQWKPEQPGLSFYELETLVKGSGTNSASSDEATLANNRRVLVVDQGQGQHRILYVAGRPSWEYKFLNRAMEGDRQLDLVALIRIARREARFAFRGRAGENSNPLFRGSANAGAEELERYDQPVLKRLNTRDELELAAGFPSSPEELFPYQALILDNVESGFFTPDQASLVQRFVSERGGALLMLGGMESFREGQYARTPIGELLPVYLDRSESPPAQGTLHFELTREGFLQEWARLRPTEAEEKERIAGMPAFQVLNPVREAKPGASVIAAVTTPGGRSYPALIAQRFGRGRSAALTIGDLWRWGMQSASAREDMEKSWRQFLRWLVTDVPRPVELTVEQQPEAAQGTVRLEVRARDLQFHPLDNARVSLEVQPVLLKSGESGPTNIVVIQAEASTITPGLYQATFAPRLAAGYRAQAVVTRSDGAEVGRAQVGWSHDPAAEEFKSLIPQRRLMEQLAAHTGGRVIPAAGLDSFARALPQQTAPVMESWSRPIWHTPLLFAFALACLIGEWGIRRTKGLP